jgi:heat shock protein HslJ
MNMRAVVLVLCGVTACTLSACADDQPVVEPAPTPAPLVGSWDVVGLKGSDGASVLTGQFADDLQLSFADNAMTGVSGCNDIFGEYTQSGADVVFMRDALGTTLVGCHEPPLLSRLMEVRQVSGSGETRSLRAEDGSVIVDLRRRSSSPHG